MGLSQALFSAISGMVNHQRRMDNIGNNLANVNTVGFKKGVHHFSTLLSQTLRGGTATSGDRGGINPISMGLGANTSSINQDFSQGALEVTGNQRDLAIEGNGFFVLRTGIEGVWNYAYTRDGAFYLGTNGKLLAGEGLHVQGITAEDGAIPESGNLGDLIIPIGQTGAAQETTTLGMTGNLNSNLAVAAPNIIVTRAVSPVANTDSTWVTGSVGNNLNLGHVQTSAALWDATAGVATLPATTATTLEDLQFLRGTGLVSPFNNIDTNNDKEIEISFQKGGRKMTAIFTYGNNDPNLGPVTGDGTTLQDLLVFLAGDVNDDGVGATDQRLRGGAMGTVHLRERDLATDGYDATSEHAGAFLRQYVGTTDFAGAATAGSHAGSVDYDNDGDRDPTVRVSIASNLGEENAITDIKLSYNNVTYTDIFSPDSDYGTVTGGSTTSNMIVYDSLGNPKNVTMQMTLVGRDTNFSTWRWIADSVDDTDATWNFDTFNQAQVAAPIASTPTTSINVGSGLIRFDSEGRFVRGSELSETGGIEITLDNQGVNNPMSISIIEGLSSSLSQDLNFASLTQVATTSDMNLKEQNGSPPGTLDSFTVTTDGIINGVFSNGVLEVLGQISLALVPNPNGLMQMGQNLYFEGANSGEPQIAAAEVGGRGRIRAGTLEQSNVDLSEEFTNLIVTQRGFQANARVISTSDEMLVELVNLKR